MAPTPTEREVGGGNGGRQGAGGNAAYLSSTQTLSGTLTQALERRSNGVICYRRLQRERERCEEMSAVPFSLICHDRWPAGVCVCLAN